MTFKNTNRRDDNEPELVEFWESCGCLWNPWKPGMGADGLLVDRYGWPYIVEVKNPKTGLALTKCEREYRDQVEKRGGRYYVIATLQEAADMIGVALDASGWLPDMKGE